MRFFRFVQLFLGALTLSLSTLAPALFADSVTTSVSCLLFTPASVVTSPSACYLSGSIPNYYDGFTEKYAVGASVSSSYTFTPTTFSTTGQASATVYSNISNSPSSQANSSISVGIDTVGAVRPGFVLITWNASATKGGGDGGGDVSFRFGSTPIDRGCSGEATTVLCIYSFLEPFTLGTPFDFTETLGVQAQSYETSDQSAASASLSLQFFEADGTTPVDIEEVAIPTPEPGSFALLIGGFLSLLCWRRIHFRPRRFNPKNPLIKNGPPRFRSVGHALIDLQ